MIISPNTLSHYSPVLFLIRLTVDLLIMAFGVFLAAKLYRKGVFDKAQRTACIVLFVWGAIVLLLTVLDRRAFITDEAVYNLQLFSCYRRVFIEHDQPMLISVLQNIFMFVPIGFTLAVIFKKHRIIIPTLISFGFSLFIEVCQLLLHSGFFEFDDLFNNTSGAFIGILLYLLYRRLWKNNKKEDDLTAENDR